MDPDHTLNSPEFDRWRVVAAESGMPLDEIEAVAKIRLRLLAAVWISQEAIPGATPSDVLQVFQAIHQEIDAGAASEWPESI